MSRGILAGCGKTTSAWQNFDDLHVCDKRRTSRILLKKARLLIRPTLTRRDAPCPKQGRSSTADPRFTFHVLPFTVLESEARTQMADFFSILLKLVVLGAVCSVALLATTVGQTIAATKKAKEPSPVVAVAKPPKQPSEQGQTPPIQLAKKSPITAVLERQPEAIQKQVKPASTERKPTSLKSPIPVATERQPEAIQQQAQPVPTGLKPTSTKSPRPMKVHKKEAPKAVVQLRTDLMYHGMLESPQRYDPRRNHHVGAGIPDPYNPELTHDHFQELDHNQDGSIDPVERVFGRLDMDRDFHDRRPR